jgi:signal transduction histidine kinase
VIAPPEPDPWLFDAPAPAQPPPSSWSTLASAGDRRGDADDGVPLRRLFLQLIAATVVVLGVVAVGGAVVARQTAERQGVHDAAALADVIATSAVQPQLTDAMLTDAALTQRVFGPLAGSLVSGSVVRVKIWTPSGSILWSDESRLVGRTFPLDDEARDALTAPKTVAAVSDLTRPENEFERTQGRLLEVYRPVWTPAGEPLLMEAYFRYDDVSTRGSQLWRGFSGIMLSSLLAVLLLLTPIVWTLAGRTRRAQAQREALLHRAADGSLAERRRIAGELHDGLVQELAAASFSVAAQAESAAKRGEPAVADALRDTASTVRAGIGVLRSLLVDLYPPNLRSAGLPAALLDLAATLEGRDTTIELDVDEAAAARLDPAGQEAVFRVAQESLRNAVRHAHATRIRLSLAVEPLAAEDVVRLDVADNGVGLPGPVPESRPDSFGLRLMMDQAESVGAWLGVRSAPGAGTTVRLEVPA